MFDAGRNYIILAAALLVFTAAFKLHMDGQTHAQGLSLAGTSVERCQSSGFNLSSKRIGCKSSGAAFSR